MNISLAIIQGAKVLKDSFIKNPYLDSEILMTEVIQKDRKTKIGTGDRSERIRTYNFPQGRVTDHRINLTLYKLEQILNASGLEEVISNLIIADQSN